MEVIAQHQGVSNAVSDERPLLRGDAGGPTIDSLASALHEEQAAERQRDAAYWKPRREQLERLRRAIVRG